MKKTSLLYILILLFCVGGIACSPFYEIEETPAPTAVADSPTPTLTPTNTPTPTNTLTPTPTNTPTPTMPPEHLEISEVMATNKTYPVNGTLCDWIELYNAGDTDISLSNFYLSDKEKKPLKSQLPDVVLKPGEYIVLTCEYEITLPGAEEKTVIKGDLSFKLSSEGETIYLTRADGLTIDTLTFENLESNNTALKDGTSELPSPGYPNTSEGNRQAALMVNAAAALAEKPGLLINEILSSNNKYNKYKNSNNVSGYYDIVELYNASAESIRLSDYYLSDGAKHLMDYRLPDVTLDPGAYILIYCMGRAATNYDDPTGIFTVPESPIELSYFGETIYLTYKDGTLRDCVTFPEMYDGVSYGRAPEDSGTFIIQEKPTLGEANQSGRDSFSETPAVSVKSGAYKSSISVEFTTKGNIYYTTDNSAPTKNSKLWDGKPIIVDKTTTIRAVSYEGDKLKSFEASFNYFIDDYDFTMDVVSISMSDTDWQKLQATTSKAGNYAISISLYKNNREEKTLVLDEEFSLTAVLELSGATSVYADKQSYQVKFKSAYGPSKLVDKLFEESELTEFQSITLRGGSQNNIRALVRDELFSSLLYAYYGEELILHEAYRPVNLYVNNEYRGVYYIREHQDVDMIASHYGVDAEDVVYSKNMATTTSCFKGGTAKDKEELLSITKLIYYSDFSDPQVLEQLCEMVDYESLLLFWATELWSDDNDCHIRVYKVGDGKWKFAIHDHDLAMTKNTIITTLTNKYFVNIVSEKGKYVYYLNGTKYNAARYQIIFTQLIKSDKFRQDLIAKLGELTKTAYSNEFAYNYAKEKLIDVIYHDMEYNCQVWAGKRLYPKASGSGSRHINYSSWKSHTNSLLKRLKNEKESVITALKKFMNMTDEEEKLYFGD